MRPPPSPLLRGFYLPMLAGRGLLYGGMRPFRITTPTWSKPSTTFNAALTPARTRCHAALRNVASPPSHFEFKAAGRWLPGKVLQAAWSHI